MTKESPPRSGIAEAKRTFCIVASRFNAQYVDGLVDHVMEELRTLAPKATISILRVPGSFEIPVVVRELAAFQDRDRPMEQEVAALSNAIASGSVC